MRRTETAVLLSTALIIAATPSAGGDWRVIVGTDVGVLVGIAVGEAVGLAVGSAVGSAVGPAVGIAVGVIVLADIFAHELLVELHPRCSSLVECCLARNCKVVREGCVGTHRAVNPVDEREAS